MGNQLTSGHKTVLAILLLAVISVLVAHYISNTVSVLIAIMFCLCLYLCRPLLMPSGYGATKVRMFSIVSAIAIAASYGIWNEFFDGFFNAIKVNHTVLQYAPWIANVKVPAGPSILVLTFVGIVIWVVNHNMRDISIGGVHSTPISEDFPERTFKKKLEAFCSALNQDITTTDRESNWSPDYYADLEAEVEVIQVSKINEPRKIIDLQKAIKSDKTTQTFLVLGDPGSGKSVALRKLAKDMLRQTKITGRIPIYINLREWCVNKSHKWSEDNPPTMQDLELFVVENIKSRGDVFTEDFTDLYFRKLWENGRLFFIFDSFDEIPGLLDADEGSWLIGVLSDLLSRFIKSNPESRGLLSSRFFRRPTSAFLAQKTLDIRPMSELRILQGLGRFPEFSPNLKQELFRNRHDLVPIARNPFLLALLGEWIKNHNLLPANQSELYQNYIRSRLLQCQKKIDSCGLTVDEIIINASKIALFIFNSPEFGLEAPMEEIIENNKIPNIAATLDILKFARLARVGSGDTKSFAFVHRRFIEYLVTTRLLNSPDTLPLEHIPTDSRGRDALVLYAQVCDNDAATRLASYCWVEIKSHFKNQYTHLRAIHCLRFLIEAFRARRDIITPLENELVEFISDNLSSGKNLLDAKICIEAAGLLCDAKAIPIFKTALKLNNSWLQETAFRACRHTGALDDDLKLDLEQYILKIPLMHFYKNYKSLSFSLSLSDSLRQTYKTAKNRYVNIVISAASAFVLMVASPAVAFAGIAVPAVFLVALKGMDLNSGGRGKYLKLFIFNSIPPADYFFQGARFFLSLSAMVQSFLLVIYKLGYFTPKNSDLNLFILDFFSWQLVSIFFSVIGFLILDFLLVKNYLMKLWDKIKNPPLHFFARLLAVLIALGIVFLMVALFVYWITEENQFLFVMFVYIIASAYFIFAIIKSILFFIRDFLHDKKMRNKFTVKEKMSRAEIACAIKSFRMVQSKIKFVSMLSVKKTVPSGSWPVDFSFPIDSDEPLMELAKLEERWLGLDR